MQIEGIETSAVGRRCCIKFISGVGLLWYRETVRQLHSVRQEIPITPVHFQNATYIYAWEAVTD